ncbi:hypothetical protein L3Q82_026190, partial [Scortum barcoo]
ANRQNKPGSSFKIKHKNICQSGQQPVKKCEMCLSKKVLSCKYVALKPPKNRRRPLTLEGNLHLKISHSRGAVSSRQGRTKEEGQTGGPPQNESAFPCQLEHSGLLGSFQVRLQSTVPHLDLQTDASVGFVYVLSDSSCWPVVQMCLQRNPVSALTETNHMFFSCSVSTCPQEEIDSASSRLSPAFSSHLHDAEQRIRMRRHLEELQLQTELLKMEKESANVTHRFYLTRRFQMLQMFCGHLQELLKDQISLRQRLMTPLGRTNLPVQAHLHRFVVEAVRMLLDFIETLEEKMNSVRCSLTARDCLAQLNTSLSQLLAQVAEVESLSNQVLQWKDICGSKLSERSA